MFSMIARPRSPSYRVAHAPGASAEVEHLIFKGYKEGPLEGTLNLIPLYSPYITPCMVPSDPWTRPTPAPPAASVLRKTLWDARAVFQAGRKVGIRGATINTSRVALKRRG